MYRLAIVGTGYVGLVCGACFANFGMKVTCVDRDKVKIDDLKNGILPIYEPGLEQLVRRNCRKGRLEFTTDIKKAVEENDIVFIAVGTPQTEDGSADLQHVMEVVEDIALCMNQYKVIVNKSTVPVGTGVKVRESIAKILEKRGEIIDFDVVSNPEFLREGTAVGDFCCPDRVVIGAETQRAVDIMKILYKRLSRGKVPFVITNIETAELIKYASNAFLAVKVSFINELSVLSEKVGADIGAVSRGMGLDKRIGEKFLNPGPGYGGSCFPKDTKAIVKTAQDAGYKLSIIEAAIEANEAQKLRMVDKIVSSMGNVQGRSFAVLGAAFKPETDDMRESPSITIIQELYKRGALIKLYDPKALKQAEQIFKYIGDKIQYCGSEYEAVKDADALIIITEWEQFKNMDLYKVRSTMRGPYFFDLRNIFQPSKMQEIGFKYYSVGR